MPRTRGGTTTRPAERGSRCLPRSEEGGWENDARRLHPWSATAALLEKKARKAFRSGCEGRGVKVGKLGE